MAAIACGMIAVGSCNGQVVSTILQTLMEKVDTELKDTFARFLALGLGLVFLGNFPLPLGADCIVPRVRIDYTPRGPDLGVK